MTGGDAGRMVTLLDGGVGTALMARGLPTDTVPERWLLERLADVVAVHREHVQAGARIVLTCTFNTHPPLLRPYGLHTFCGELRRLAVHAAREAGAPKVHGVIGPLPPRMDALQVSAWAEAAAADLAAAGVDGLVAETITHLDEGVARVRGAALTGLTVVASIVPGTPAAEDPARASQALFTAGAGVVGVNCGTPSECRAVLSGMARGEGALLWAKPSAGTPQAPVDASRWVEGTAGLLSVGAGLLGGCCGVDAAMLASLRAALLARLRD